jgi:hypothetical protein
LVAIVSGYLPPGVWASVADRSSNDPPRPSHPPSKRRAIPHSGDRLSGENGHFYERRNDGAGPVSELKEHDMATATPAAAPVAAAATPVKKAPEQLPTPNSDFYQLADVLTAEEKAIVKKVRAYMETEVQPIINRYWSDDAFPFELLPSFKELQLGGLGYEGYGCAGGSQKLFGFVAMELARVDASFCTFFGVHSGLAMGSIYLDGSEEQKRKWLPPMARWEKIGCFGLTEPLVGSGTSGGMTTTAKREKDTWILNGQKRWIGNATWCDVSIIWARDVADNQVKGFIVENKTTPGFSVEKIEHKMALKVVQNGQITLKDVRVPEANRLPAGRQLVPRYRAGAADDAVHGGLGLDRRADGRVRGNAQVRPGAIAVRQADRLVPDGAGSPRQDARQRHGLPVPHGPAGADDR